MNQTSILKIIQLRANDLVHKYFMISIEMKLAIHKIGTRHWTNRFESESRTKLGTHEIEIYLIQPSVDEIIYYSNNSLFRLLNLKTKEKKQQ